jgi:uncharacterized membrane protein HdeD (DUF308 family)
MLESLQKNWWLVALRGLVALSLGVIMLFYPIASVYVLVIFFGAYAIVDGLFAVIVALMAIAQHKHKWWLFVEGVLGLTAGIMIFIWPGITAIILLYFIAFWALFTGILEIIFCVAQWKVLPNNWLWLLSGILSILLGIIMFVNPGTGALTVVFFIALYLIFFGVVLLGMGITLRGQTSQVA